MIACKLPISVNFYIVKTSAQRTCTCRSQTTKGLHRDDVELPRYYLTCNLPRPYDVCTMWVRLPMPYEPWTKPICRNSDVILTKVTYIALLRPLAALKFRG